MCPLYSVFCGVLQNDEKTGFCQIPFMCQLIGFCNNDVIWNNQCLVENGIER